MNTNRTVAQLRGEVRALGLDPKPSRTTKAGVPKFLKRDYIRALQEHHLGRVFPSGPPPALDAVLSLESPMLCFRYTGLKPEEQAALWSSSEWVFEEKIDGLRVFVILADGALHFYSPRQLSPRDYFPVQYVSVLHSTETNLLAFDSFVLDCEVTCEDPMLRMRLSRLGVPAESDAQAVSSLLVLPPSESMKLQREGCGLVFHAIDVLNVNGLDTTPLTFRQRRRGLRTLVGDLKESGMNVVLPETWEGEALKRSKYEEIVSRGGEGVVAKHTSSQYIPRTTRKRDGWVKVKRVATKSLTSTRLGDTLDAWVSGARVGEDGLVETLIHPKDRLPG